MEGFQILHEILSEVFCFKCGFEFQVWHSNYKFDLFHIISYQNIKGANKTSVRLNQKFAIFIAFLLMLVRNEYMNYDPFFDHCSKYTFTYDYEMIIEFKFPAKIDLSFS